MAAATVTLWLELLSRFLVVAAATFFLQSGLLLAIGLLVAALVKNRGAAVQSLVLRTTLLAVILSPVLAYTVSVAGFRGALFRLERYEPLKSRGRNTESERFRPVPLYSFSSPRADTKPAPLPPPGGAGPELTVDEPPPAEKTDGPAAGLGHFSSPPASQDKNPGTTPPMTPPANDNAVRFIPFLAAVVTVTWIVTTLWLFFRLGMHTLYVHLVISRGRPASAALLASCRKLARDAGIAMPHIVQSSRVGSPFLAGIIHPTIMMPAGMVSLEEAEREILLHELAHHERRDQVWNLLGHVVLALFPFQPLLWLLVHRLESASDYVCDGFVVARESDRKAYATTLFRLACSCRPAFRERMAGVGILTFKSTLRKRIERIVNAHGNLSLKASGRCCAVTAVVCLVVQVSVSLVAVGYTEVAAPLADSDGTGAAMIVTLAGIPVDRSPSDDDENERDESSPEESGMALSGEAGDTDTVEVTMDTPKDDLPDRSAAVTAPPVTSPVAVVAASSTENSGGTRKPADPGQPVSERPPVETATPSDLPAETPKEVVLKGMGEAEAKEMFGSRTTGMGVAAVRDADTPEPAAKIIPIAIDVDYQDIVIDDEHDQQLYDRYFGLAKNKWDPAVSPDGKQLAFTDLYRIWTVPASGGSPELVYEPDYVYGKPVETIRSLSFSANSRELTFRRTYYDQERGSLIKDAGSYLVLQNPITNIESIDLKTGEHRVIIRGGDYPSWSLNGRHLCYIHYDYNAGLGNSTAKYHGVPAVYDRVSGTSIFLEERAPKNGYFLHPCISPDGSELVVCRYHSEAGVCTLIRYFTDGRPPQQLDKYHAAAVSGSHNWYPAYSPDGSWILYTSKPNGETSNLYVCHLETRRTFRVLGNEEYNHFYGIWMPDGEHVGYFHDEGRREFYVHPFDSKSFLAKITTTTSAPERFAITGNYPNPFNPSTTLTFSLDRDSDAVLDIFAVNGQKVRTLVSSPHTAGSHSVVWDGCDDRGMRVSSGVYIARLVAGGRMATHRMTLLK